MVKPSIPLIVLTGGPSAGKTAVIEMLRRMVCPHVAVLPESAGILFSGGFWRLKSVNGRMHAQRAIYFVQNESENLAAGEELFKVAVCDRGTLDGLAYWPSNGTDFLGSVDTTREEELARYSLVVHMRTPPADEYNVQNPIRTETPQMAEMVDRRIEEVWAGHPHRVFIENNPHFLEKARQALRVIIDHLPVCCECMTDLKSRLGREL